MNPERIRAFPKKRAPPWCMHRCGTASPSAPLHPRAAPQFRAHAVLVLRQTTHATIGGKNKDFCALLGNFIKQLV